MEKLIIQPSPLPLTKEQLKEIKKCKCNTCKCKNKNR